MFRDDEIRLRHMMDAAREAISFADGRVRDDLNGDRQLVLSLLKAVEIVGEAAAQVTAPTRAEFPEIPWQAMVAMRNRLVHVYFSINLDIVWQTIEQDMPALVARLEAILEREADR